MKTHTITVEDARYAVNQTIVSIASSVGDGENKSLLFDLQNRAYAVYSDYRLVKRTKRLSAAVKAYNQA
ncbi:hypothetical protein E4H12_01970 [Candidatus Thorarchaeota archaeon]|nr:MAG: hypothetical protein E4H12_01970 [Candidatus Thorarchaeota archaeon]